MTNIKILSTSKLSLFKIFAFASSLCLVVIYDWIPEQKITLYPNETATLSLFSDEDIGGNSRAKWVDQAKSKFTCIVPKSDTTQFCGGTVTWFKDSLKTYNLSKYQRLIMEINYQGSAPKLAVNLYNQTKKIEGIVDTTEAKAMSANVSGADFSSQVSIRFSDFRVADWWLSQHNIPREYAHIEFNEITSVGISPTAPYSHEMDTFQINAIYGLGAYFSKENLYASLLMFWTCLFIGEALVRYWILRQRIMQDAEKLQTLSDISAKYKIKAETDALTGLSNREGLAQMLKAIEQNGTMDHYSLLVIDIDHFKGLNDRYGHDVGDLVLEELARLINSSIRSTDIVCRWGGEEFVVLFRYAKLQDVYPFAEKIRLEITRFIFAGSLSLTVNVSIGIALMSADKNFKNVFKLADKALYAAKRSGRNQSIMAPQNSSNNHN
jgi:diguanylate cyclase (GGDEF)-like protein